MTKNSLKIVPAAEPVDEGMFMRRRYQEGSISLDQKTGNFTLRFLEDVRLDDGTVKRRNRRVYLGNKNDGMTEKMARRAAQPYIASANNSTQPKSLITFGQYVDKWLPMAMPRYASATQEGVKRSANMLRAKFGEIPMSNIGVEQVERFLNSLPSRAVAGITATYARIMWKDAKRWGYIQVNPLLELEVIAAKTKESRYFTPEQLVQILNVAPEPTKTLYWLLAQTGLRIGEVLALTWDTCDLENGTVSVRDIVYRGKLLPGQTKTDAGKRRIPISVNLSEHLRKYRENWTPNSYNLVFANSAGSPWADSAILIKKLHPLLAQLGIPKAGFHAFRHASATLLDRMHAPMKIRQSRMGHASAAMTIEKYTHILESDAREVANGFDAILTPQLPEKAMEVGA